MFSVQISDTDRHVAICIVGGEVQAVYYTEDTDANAKDGLPRLQSLTGLSDGWTIARVTGEYKNSKRGRGSA